MSTAAERAGVPFLARMTCGDCLAGPPDFWAFEVASALYWYCADFHGGQSSDLYAMLGRLEYTPAASESGPERDSTAEMLYEALECEDVTAEALEAELRALQAAMKAEDT